jgi:hypothetical protein
MSQGVPSTPTPTRISNFSGYGLIDRYIGNQRADVFYAALQRLSLPINTSLITNTIGAMAVRA